jgi:hypothetical protein
VRLYIADGAIAVLRLRGRVYVSWREVWRHEQRSTPGVRMMAACKRPLLTVDEAAALTRYRPGYLYALAARGEIPTCRVFGDAMPYPAAGGRRTRSGRPAREDRIPVPSLEDAAPIQQPACRQPYGASPQSFAGPPGCRAA